MAGPRLPPDPLGAVGPRRQQARRRPRRSGETVARWLTRPVPREEGSAPAVSRGRPVGGDRGRGLDAVHRRPRALTARVRSGRGRGWCWSATRPRSAPSRRPGMFEHLTHVLRRRVIPPGRAAPVHRPPTKPPPPCACARRPASSVTTCRRADPPATSSDAADAVFPPVAPEAATDGGDALMLAQAWTDVTALNRRARAVAVATGRSPDPPSSPSRRGPASTWAGRAAGLARRRRLLAKKNARDPSPSAASSCATGTGSRVLAATSDGAGWSWRTSPGVAPPPCRRLPRPAPGTGGPRPSTAPGATTDS